MACESSNRTRIAVPDGTRGVAFLPDWAGHESAEVRGPITFHRGEALLYGTWHLVSHNARKPVRKEALR